MLFGNGYQKERFWKGRERNEKEKNTFYAKISIYLQFDKKCWARNSAKNKQDSTGSFLSWKHNTSAAISLWSVKVIPTCPFHWFLKMVFMNLSAPRVRVGSKDILNWMISSDCPYLHQQYQHAIHCQVSAIMTLKELPTVCEHWYMYVCSKVFTHALSHVNIYPRVHCTNVTQKKRTRVQMLTGTVHV